MDSEFISVKAVATRLKLSLGGAYRLIRQGEIPSVRVGGSVRVPAKLFEAWLESRTTGVSW